MSLAGDGREIRTLTNSECESWLIVVDTVALENFSTTQLPAGAGMEWTGGASRMEGEIS